MDQTTSLLLLGLAIGLFAVFTMMRRLRVKNAPRRYAAAAPRTADSEFLAALPRIDGELGQKIALDVRAALANRAGIPAECVGATATLGEIFGLKRLEGGADGDAAGFVYAMRDRDWFPPIHDNMGKLRTPTAKTTVGEFIADLARCRDESA